MSAAVSSMRERIRYEMLDGRVRAMAPQSSNHKIVADNLYRIFSTALRGKKCMAFADGMDVKLTETDKVVPDMIVVCNRDIIKSHAVHGAPDLLVEVLSPSSVKRDRGYKKDLYERCGVKEYWIVDTNRLSVEIYTLAEGKLEFHNLFEIIPEDEFNVMDEEERAEIVYEFSPFLFPEINIELSEIFEDMIK